MDNKYFSLPLSYTVRFDNSSNKLKFKMPIIMTEVDGAKSYTLGFGMELGLQLTGNWVLTPAVNYAAMGSVALGSAGPMASGSITSAYQFVGL
ncbi:hypothetical protein VU04_08860 [Desulfobulbus sp. TB]|nr:hypothetical protein [Desulfobulbus sp. TB]